MRRIWIVAAVVALAVTSAARADDWTTADTALQASVAALQVADWGQTSWGMEHGYAETNPLLGAHPSPTRLNLMVPAAILGHALVARLLPHPYRTAWQATAIVVEVGYVTRNASLIGLRWSLP
jgi:hypothetical protein